MKRITLSLPEHLLNEAMRVTRTKTKTAVIVLALEALLIRKERIAELKQFKRKIELDIDLDLDNLRVRR